MSEQTTSTPRRRTITRFLLTGLAVLLPVFVTGYIVFALYRFVDTNLGWWLAWLVGRALGTAGPSDAATRFAGDVLAVVIVLGVAVSAGALAASYIGRRIIRAAEQFILKVPFVRDIYPYVKQVTDFVLTDKKLQFHSVVAVPYPRKGVYSVGFVTGQGMRSINEATRQRLVQVFIPSSPTPVTGYVVFVPPDELIKLPLSVDQVLRFSISAGVIVPPQEIVEAAVEAREQQQLAVPGEHAEAGEE